MSRSRRLQVGLLILFLGVAVAFIMWPTDKKQNEAVEVYVSKDTIPSGEELKDSFFEKKEVLKAERWMLTDLALLEGKQAVRIIPKGRYIDPADFSDPQGGLIVHKGEGEFTIRVKAENVNGGRLKPGDLVKVFFVGRPKSGLEEEPTDGSGEEVVTDVMVLSVRTQYAKDVDEDKDDLNNVPAAVTLKVTPEQGAKLAWKQEYGTLSVYVQGKE